ncbi:MAG: ligase-associated DNA damage response endonuclease PdeM [Pseudomonadota bacterium]
MSLGDRAGFGMAALGAFSIPGPKVERDDAPAERPASASAFLAGIDATLDASGALWWSATRTLVVSDLHLETGSSYARTGQMLPPYDSAMTLARLAEVIGYYLPRRIVFLGDSFHDPFGAERLDGDDRATLGALCRAAEVIWITGNHDHDSAATFGGVACEATTLDGIAFRHIPTEGVPTGLEIAGHLHPAARIVVRGRRIKRRAFVGCPQRLVMPAFGCLTGGLPVTDPAFAPLWPAPTAPEVHMIGANRVYSL